MKKNNPPNIKPLFVLSDGTGETAEKVVRAVLKQFTGYLVFVQKFPHINTREQLQEVMLQGALEDALLVSTLVRPDLRIAAQELGTQNRIRYIDIFGNLLSQMSFFLRAKPEGVPNQMHQVDDEYFKRIEAVEFTVRGDDGKDPHLLHRADIVLVGVSRTSKTPLSVFLAHKGYKVCNIPIVLEKELPSILHDIDQRCVFALTIDPDTLQQIRKQRLKTMRVAQKSNYSDLGYILAELDWANTLFRSQPEWPVIDVTKRAVEETASIILKILADRGLAKKHGDIGQL